MLLYKFIKALKSEHYTPSANFSDSALIKLEFVVTGFAAGRAILYTTCALWSGAVDSACKYCTAMLALVFWLASRPGPFHSRVVT
jgi:hypothetical protein